MFRKLRYAYHATKVETLLKEGKTDTEAYRKHKRKLNEVFLECMDDIARKGTRA